MNAHAATIANALAIFFVLMIPSRVKTAISQLP
jgi:hypothetical protein